MELDVNLINPFLTASKNVIATTTGIQTTIGKPCLKETKFEDDSVLISIGITGDIEGQAMIHFYEKDALFVVNEFMGKMMGMVIASLDEMGISALSELGNQIMGNVSTIFFTNNIKTDITPPTVIRGNFVMSRNYATNICVPFLKEDGTELFGLNMAIRKD